MDVNNTNGHGEGAGQLEEGNLNQTFPLPEMLEYELNGAKYRFCSHCHTPKPAAQVPIQDTRHPGICVNCVNGINNYDRLAAAGLIPYRPGTSAPQPKPAKQPKAPTAKAEGESANGAEAPTPKRSRKEAHEAGETTDGIPLGTDVTTGEPVGKPA